MGKQAFLSICSRGRRKGEENLLKWIFKLCYSFAFQREMKAGTNQSARVQEGSVWQGTGWRREVVLGDLGEKLWGNGFYHQFLHTLGSG